MELILVINLIQLDLDQLKLQTGTDQGGTELREKPAQKYVKIMG